MVEPLCPFAILHHPKKFSTRKGHQHAIPSLSLYDNPAKAVKKLLEPAEISATRQRQRIIF
jgi:hypothetical protein